MKSTMGWKSPNTSATNSSCFSALPGGIYYGDFSSVGDMGDWWSSTVNDENYSNSCNLNYNGGWLGEGIGSRESGLSARCVRD